jgi:hypothetical protein
LREFLNYSHRCLVIAAGTLAISTAAAAQGAVGSGPLTSTLPDTEPTGAAIRLGPLRLAPGVTIRGYGHDDNVFDEAENPKEDWVIAGTPDVTVFTRVRLLQLSAHAGSDMQYYWTYESENDIGYSYSGRLNLLFSRLTPFVGAGTNRVRARPNGEVDVRADHKTDEFSGGVAYELSPRSQMFAAAIQTDVDYRDAFQSGVSLDQSLNRRTTEYQGGLQTMLTPLLKMQVRGAYRKDEFELDPARNGDSRLGTAVFSFDPAAVVSGNATIGYQDYRPVDPLVHAYRGVTGSGFITYPFLDFGRFNFGYNRSVEYSFDTAEAYYVDNTLSLTYTHRLFGEVDAQGRGSWSTFDYGQRSGSTGRQDSLESYLGNLGYNLRNRTRIAMNYEYARRRSPEIADRNYIRRRVYLSWLAAF